MQVGMIAWCWKSLQEDALYGWEVSEGEIQPSLQNNSASLHHQDHSEPPGALYVTHLSEMEQLDLLSCWLWIPNLVYTGTKELFASLCLTLVKAKFWENLKYLYDFKFFFSVKDNWKWAEESSALTFLYSKSRIIRKVIEWLF